MLIVPSSDSILNWIGSRFGRLVCELEAIERRPTGQKQFLVNHSGHDELVRVPQ